MMKHVRLCTVFFVLVGVLGVGCGSSGGSSGYDMAPDLWQPPPVLGQPLTLPQGSDWQWVDFPDSTCDEGTPTGVGLSLSPSASPTSPGSGDLFIFLTGGGACWDRSTCLVLNLATHGPFTKTQFMNMKGELPGSILDRALPGSPVADWNMVFVPYCTGDVHGGDNVGDYGQPYYHKGHANFVAFMKRLGPTFASARNVILSGSSAGGYGAAINYYTLRPYFPNAQVSLIDDAGTILIGNEIPIGERQSWYSAWRLDLTLDPQCPGCRNDMSLLIPEVVQRYPHDRMALLSYTQDEVIRNYLFKTPQDFQTDLFELLQKRLDPSPISRYFIEAGETHTLLPHPGKEVSQGVALVDWLRQMITRDQAWQSLKP